MKLAYVVWRDAVQDQADAEGPVHAQVATLAEVGWLLDENAEAICIGMENHETAQGVVPGRFRLHIPRANIKLLCVTDLGKAFPKRSVVWQA